MKPAHLPHAQPPAGTHESAPPPGDRQSAPFPGENGTMSTRAKLSLAEVALALHEEQVQARIVHYKAELETSPELDAITAQVVAELQSLQAAVAKVTAQSQSGAPDRGQVEIELITNLKIILTRLFPQGRLASFIERKLGEISKRFARLFFASELHEKMAGGKKEPKQMRSADQALYHVFARAEPDLTKALEGFEYVGPEILPRAKEVLQALVKDYRNKFLGWTTPELNALVKILNEVLHAFFTKELPPAVGELAWEVVREARLAEGKMQGGYKVAVDAFPAFRQAFERRFLNRLVTFAADAMLLQVSAREGKFRKETIRFVAEPQIFSDVCDVICDAVYDSLYNDGFLDLPQDWRACLSTSLP
jgi:hypothetical protein